MTPRRARPFKKVPFRKHGYGTQAASDILTERGLPTTAWMLRSAADKGLIHSTRSPGGHRRFLAADLEQYLCVKI